MQMVVAVLLCLVVFVFPYFSICLKESHLFNSLNGILLSLDHPLVDHRWTLLRYLVATPNDELVRQVASAKAIAGSWRLENGTEESQ